MLLHEAALEYWKASQHVQALPDQAAREAYALAILVPRRDGAPEASRRSLLSRLIDRVLFQAAA